MDTEPTAEVQAEEELGYDRSEWDSTGTFEPTQGQRPRTMRVDDYESAGLRKTDPLEACVAAMNADLIRIAFELGDSLQSSLAAGPATIESVRRVEGALNNHLRVTRQIDRFAQLEIRAAESRQKLTRAKQD